MQYQLSILRVLNTKLGTHIEFHVSLEHFPELIKDQDFTPDLNQEIKLDAYRIENGLCLIIPKQKIRGKATDSITGDKFETEIETFPTEKNYYLKVSEEELSEEIGKINSKSQVVEIDDLLNEAVFLNLPLSFRKNQSDNSESRIYSSKKNSNNNKTLKDFFDF